MKVATTTITIPEDLSEITLGQYQHYIKVCEGLEGDALSQRTVNVLCDIKLHDVMMLRLTDIREIEQHLHALFKMDQELQTTFKIKAQEFGFITDLEAISFGEYVDLDKYMNDWETMHKAMAVLYRPTTKRIDDKYNIIEYEGTEDYADLMRFMPLDVALGAMVFFYRLGNELLKTTRSYLLQQTEELMKEQTSANKHNSIDSGDGTTVSTPSLVETLEHLTMLPEFELPAHLHI